MEGVMLARELDELTGRRDGRPDEHRVGFLRPAYRALRLHVASAHHRVTMQTNFDRMQLIENKHSVRSQGDNFSRFASAAFRAEFRPLP